MLHVNRRVGLGVAVFLVAASGLGAILLLRAPNGPPEAEGRSWMTAFADRLTSPKTWSAKGPAALALFPRLGPWSGGDCIHSWSTSNERAAIVTYQRLDLGRFGTEPCNQAQFGMLSTTLRQSEGITPGALVALFDERFGPPEIYRDQALHGTIRYTWQVQDGIFATLKETVQPGGAKDFSVLFVRSHASPTSLASPAEGEAWMSQTVDLVTGPDLVNARGSAVVKLLDADMQPSAIGDATCPTMFNANLLIKGPIGTGQSLILERPRDTSCEHRQFSWFSMRIWQRAPVTAAALVERITAKLGAAEVSRNFERNGIIYRWTTRYGSAVEFSEDLSEPGRYWLGLRAWRL